MFSVYSYLSVLSSCFSLAWASRTLLPLLPCLSSYLASVTFDPRLKILVFAVKKGKLSIFCRNEWPKFRVGWPEEGTFDLPTIFRIKDLVCGRPGHPNQVPYITTWQTLVESRPEWLAPLLPPLKATLVATASSKAPHSSKAPRKSNPNPSVPSAPSLYPVLPLSDPPLEDLSFPHPPSYESTPLPNPPEPSPMEEEPDPEDPPMSPPHTHSRDRRAPGNTPGTVALPLRVAGPPGPDGQQFLVHWPFSTSDSYNWKMQNPPSLRNPVNL